MTSYTTSNPIEIKGRSIHNNERNKRPSHLRLSESWNKLANSFENEKSKWLNALSPTSLSPKSSFKKDSFSSSMQSPKDMLISEKVLNEDEISILNNNEFDDVIQFGYRIEGIGYTQFTPTIKLSLTPSKLNNNYPRRSLVWPYE